jgi:hypothetical protein
MEEKLSSPFYDVRTSSFGDIDRRSTPICAFVSSCAGAD